MMTNIEKQVFETHQWNRSMEKLKNYIVISDCQRKWLVSTKAIACEINNLCGNLPINKIWQTWNGPMPPIYLNKSSNSLIVILLLSTSLLFSSFWKFSDNLLSMFKLLLQFSYEVIYYLFDTIRVSIWSLIVIPLVLWFAFLKKSNDISHTAVL